MSEPMTHVARLTKAWLKGDPKDREVIRHIWPELADCLDAVTWRPKGEVVETAAPAQAPTDEQLRSRLMRKPGEERCLESHAVNSWPFVARCVLPGGHPFRYDHIDVHDHEWRNEPCDGCKSIDRMRENLTPKDETAHYEFQRAAKKHRRECPNR